MLCDVYERDSGIPEMLGQRAIVVALRSGDYAGNIAIGGMWGAERKHLTQFLQDMSSGVLKNQLIYLMDYYNVPILIPEGKIYPDKFGKCVVDGWMKTNYFYRSYKECLNHWKLRGVIIEETENQKDTAARLIAIEDFFLDEKNAAKMVTERVFSLGTKRDPLLDIIARFPLVGHERAKALLIEFGNIQTIVNADIKDLQKVEGIGKTIANKIYEVVRREWRG